MLGQRCGLATDRGHAIVDGAGIPVVTIQNTTPRSALARATDVADRARVSIFTRGYVRHIRTTGDRVTSVISAGVLVVTVESAQVDTSSLTGETDWHCADAIIAFVGTAVDGFEDALARLGITRIDCADVLIVALDIVPGDTVPCSVTRVVDAAKIALLAGRSVEFVVATCLRVAGIVRAGIEVIAIDRCAGTGTRTADIRLSARVIIIARRGVPRIHATGNRVFLG